VVFGVFILLIALGTTVFVDRRVRLAVITTAAVLGLLGGLENVDTQRSQAGRIARAIEATARPGDIVAYCPDQLGPGVSRLLGDGYVQLTYPAERPPEIVDWVDYEKRVDAADPVAFADALDARAGTGHDVFLVWSGGYRTHEGVCERVVGRLAERRATTRPVQARPKKYFEYSELHRFQPR
jgi:hypothetical protein